jgi:hypothetical protein
MATAGKRLKELSFEFKPKIFKANGQFTFLEPDNYICSYKIWRLRYINFQITSVVPINKINFCRSKKS